MECVVQEGLPSSVFLNVNYPGTMKKVKGFKLTRMHQEKPWDFTYTEKTKGDKEEEKSESEDERLFFVSVEKNQLEDEEKNDAFALREGWITVCPISTQLINIPKEWLEKIQKFKIFNT